MNWVTPMMTLSTSAARPGIPSLTKPFCPFFCLTPRKVVSPVFQLRKTDPLSTINSTAFWCFLLHSFFFNWATAVLSPVQCMREIVSMSVLCISIVYVSCFSSFGFFCLICLSHLVPHQTYAPNRWLKYFFLFSCKFFFKCRGAPYALCHFIHQKLQCACLTDLQLLAKSAFCQLLNLESYYFFMFDCVSQDKAADFSTANSVGVRNNIFAILLLGSYEVLMEHSFTAGNFRYFLRGWLHCDGMYMLSVGMTSLWWDVHVKSDLCYSEILFLGSSEMLMEHNFTYCWKF